MTNLLKRTVLAYIKRKSKQRAKKAGFLSEHPTIPEKITESSMLGYQKRVRNWNKKLIQYEKSCLNY